MRGKRGLNEEENVTDVKEREKLIKKDKQGCRLHILAMALHIDWLAKQRMIEIDVQNSIKANYDDVINVDLQFVSYVFILSRGNFVKCLIKCSFQVIKPGACLP